MKSRTRSIAAKNAWKTRRAIAKKRSDAARKGWKTRRAKVDYIVTTRYTWTDKTSKGKARTRTEAMDWVVPYKKGATEDDVLIILRDATEKKIQNDTDVDIEKIMGHLGKFFNEITFGNQLAISPHSSFDVVELKTHEYKKITARDYSRIK